MTSLSFAYPGVSAGDRAAILQPRATAEGTEVFVLATCLRVELAWRGGPDETPAIIDELYGNRSIPAAKTRTDLDAFHHLARVATGLESAQVGEVEVLTQFRQAVDDLAGRSADHGLVRVMETAVGVARAARRSLVAPRDVSLAKMAVRMAGDPQGVVVLGGGAMARAVVQELNHPDVAVFARRPATVAGMVPNPWERLPRALASCRAVISTVPGPVPVIEDMDRPNGDPLLVVDLGMPPAVSGIDPARLIYYGIDEVASSLPTDREPETEDVLAVESEKAWARLTVSPEASAILSSLIGRVDEAVDDEVRRFVGRFSSAEEPEAVLRQLAHTVARRIIHPSVSLLGSSRLTQRETDLLAEALGVERE